MTGDDLAERLVRLGLTRYESRAYQALVRRADSTPAEIARAAGIPRPRVYDVLRSLVAKGVAADRPGAPTRFSPSPPDEAVQVLLDEHRRRLADAERDGAAVAQALQPAFDAGQRLTAPLDYVEVVRDVEVLRRRYAELQARTQREMLVFNKMPAAVRLSENDAGLELASRADLRGLYEFGLLADPEDVAGIRRFVQAGERARFVESLPTKLAVIDERIVMVAMVDPLAGEPRLTTMIVDNAELAVCLKVTFEHYWAQSVSFDEALERVGTQRR
jgi:sugar-specific transcriptional regulator TrmB